MLNTSALEDPSAACLKFEEMHDGVKAQKEKCTKPPSKKVSVFIKMILALKSGPENLTRPH